LWRNEEAVGFALPDTDAELVVYLNIGQEIHVVVDNVGEAFAFFLSAGGEAARPPFDIAIGRCARVRDPFGNELTLLDQSKGRLATDREG
jgi:predicted enzyme related to lactoylglutathione lyase